MSPHFRMSAGERWMEEILTLWAITAGITNCRVLKCPKLPPNSPPITVFFENVFQASCSSYDAFTAKIPLIANGYCVFFQSPLDVSDVSDKSIWIVGGFSQQESWWFMCLMILSPTTSVTLYLKFAAQRILVWGPPAEAWQYFEQDESSDGHAVLGEETVIICYHLSPGTSFFFFSDSNSKIANWS